MGRHRTGVVSIDLQLPYRAEGPCAIVAAELRLWHCYGYKPLWELEAVVEDCISRTRVKVTHGVSRVPNVLTDSSQDLALDLSGPGGKDPVMGINLGSRTDRGTQECCCSRQRGWIQNAVLVGLLHDACSFARTRFLPLPGTGDLWPEQHTKCTCRLGTCMAERSEVRSRVVCRRRAES